MAFAIRGQAVRASALGGGIGARSSLRCADDLPMVSVGGNEMQQSPSFSSRRGAAALARQPARVVVPVEIAKRRDRRLVAHGKSESDVGYLFLICKQVRASHEAADEED